MNKKIKKSMLVIFTLFMSNYIYANINDLNNFDPSKYYKPDTDGDGIIDIYDSEPNVYNVTDRDLRFFQEITYRTPEEINKLFNNDKSYIEYFNREKLKNGADVREITKNWKFVEQVTDTNGFQASIFSNGNQAVLAFTGTNDGKDVGNDISIGFATTPSQAGNAERIVREKLKNYSRYYMTGHSLGGYLTMYAGATSAFNDSRFIHGAVFNSPGLNLTFNRQVWSNSDKNIYANYVDNSDKRYVKDLKKIQAYGIHGDSVAGIKQIPTTKWNNQVTSGINVHSSSNFFSTKNDSNFRQWFSTGYRLDNPYLTLDTDGDGILDVDELKIGTDYMKFDSDSDGFSDKIELAFSTDPMNSNSKPLLSTFYKGIVYGWLNVERKSDINRQNIESRLTFYIKSEFSNYTKHIPSISKYNVSYIFENEPSNWQDVKDYLYLLKFRVKLPDNSITDIAELSIEIKENKENKNKKESEIYDINIPSKIGVFDKNSITEEEKKLIEKNIIENNKNIPKKYTLEIDKSGNVTVRFEDKSEKLIENEKIVYQKPMNETFDITNVEKTGIENLNLLTTEEKEKIKEKIKLIDKNNRILNINIADNGDTNIVFIDNTNYTIDKGKLVYQSLEGLKQLISNAESLFMKLNEIINSTNIISPDKKSEIDNKNDEYKKLKLKISEKLNTIKDNIEGLDELKSKNNKLTNINEVKINDYNSNGILDEQEIEKVKLELNETKKLFEQAKQKKSEIEEDNVIDEEERQQLDSIISEYEDKKNKLKVLIDNLGTLKEKASLYEEFINLYNIESSNVNDVDKNKKDDTEEINLGIIKIEQAINNMNNVIKFKDNIAKNFVISKIKVDELDNLISEYNNLKKIATDYVNSLGEIPKKDELLLRLNELVNIESLNYNDYDSNGIIDSEEINKAYSSLEKVINLSKEIDLKIENLDLITPNIKKEVDLKIDEYLLKKQNLKSLIDNLNLEPKQDLLVKYEKLKEYSKLVVNDIDDNKIKDKEEVELVREKINEALNFLSNLRNEKNNISDKPIMKDKEYIDSLIEKYDKLRNEAISKFNNLSDLILEKSSLKVEIDKLEIEESIEVIEVNKNKLKKIIEISNEIKKEINYEKSSFEIKKGFDEILLEAEKIYNDERANQEEIDDIVIKLENIHKKLDGNLNDSLKYVNLLHYNDTSIANMFYNDGLFFNINLKKSYINYFQDIIKNEFKLNDIFGGVQLGYNKKVNSNLSVGVFTEYNNTTVHNISLGFDLKNSNFIFFTRYRLSILPKYKIYSNNLDLYIKAGHYFDLFKYFKIEPSLSIYSSYMIKTYLPNDVYIDHKVSANIEASINMMYLNKGYRAYLNPKIKYVYDTPILYDKNGNKLKYTNNNYFDYVVSLGLEKKINFITLGGDFTFNGNKNSMNYSFNTYINFDW